jgi:hypothetical protein
METPRKIEVFFEDHYSLGEDWFEKGSKHEQCILSCLGYLVHEDETYYYIVNTFEPKTEDYQAGTAVVKSCVISFIEYGTDRTVKPSRRNQKLNGNKKKN